MSYPAGPLLKALAPRVLANLERIERLAEEDPGSAFPETQLLISLLGVLIFPHERAGRALSSILQGYEPLKDAITVLHRQREAGSGVDSTDTLADGSLTRMLRNSLAHFNVLPRETAGRFTGVRVWNEKKGCITFVADLDLAEVRRLAEHVLERLASGDVVLEDPVDPMRRIYQA